MERFLFNLRIASEALFHNKLRSFLTALGIIFGVASVIAMQAIGRGARQEILDQIKLVGVNNIVVTQKAKDPEKDKKDSDTDKKTEKKGSLGLSLSDMESIRTILPEVEHVSPEATYKVFAIRNGKGHDAQLLGVTRDYFPIHNLQIENGEGFTEAHIRYGMPVCVIGAEVRKKFFSNENPIGKFIKCGKVWLKVVGVLESRSVTQEEQSSLGISNYNLDIYSPITTVLLRHHNRALITKAILNSGGSSDGDIMIVEGEESNKSRQYNELDKLVIQVSDSRYLKAVADVVSKTLQRRHNGVVDFDVIIPELLLKQQQRTKDIFNLVLGTIASISLLVGGIGIMNIMLVSVMERLKEIGIRMSLGATRKDIVQQFLAEAILISIGGGIVGVLLGILIAQMVMRFTDILTIVTPMSVMVAFLVSGIVGLASGLAPARKAAQQDPVESLRYE